MSRVENKPPEANPIKQLGNLAVTKEEEDELARFVAQFPSDGRPNYPVPEEKHGVFHFLTEALRATDSSKVGNIDKEEIMVVRNLKEGSLFFNMMGSKYVATWLQGWSEMILATSASKNGFLITAAITQKKDVKLGTAQKEKRKSSWLKNKESGSNDQD